LNQGRPEVMRELCSPQFVDELRFADIIRGVDERTGNTFILFGRSTLQAIITSGRPMPVDVVTTTILQETVELEALCTAVKMAKGYHEYEAAASSLP